MMNEKVKKGEKETGEKKPETGKEKNGNWEKRKQEKMSESGFTGLLNFQDEKKIRSKTTE